MSGTGNDTPAGWARTRVGEVAGVVRDRLDPQAYPDLPFIGMENVEAHTMRVLGTVPASTMRSASVHFLPGDVLYGRLRPYLNKVVNPEYEGLCSAEFIPLTPKAGVNARFLQFRLNSADFVSFASHLDEGDRPRVDFGQIGVFPIDLPPTPEQHRIVAAIEDHFSRLDEAVALLERVRRNLKRYRASVLKAAVEGRLVPTEADLARAEGRAYEPASVLLARILDERRRRWKAEGGRGTYKEPVAPDTTDLPELPEGWCWGTVGQVAPLQAGFAFSSNGFRPVGVRLVKGNNVRDGWLFSDEIDHWDSEDVDQFQQYRLGEGDIVLAMDRPVYSSGTKATKVARLDSSWEGSFLLQRVGCFRRAEGIDARYLYWFLTGDGFREHIVRTQNGSQDGKDLPHVSAGVVDSCPVPVPPCPEQQRIGAELERLVSNSDSWSKDLVSITSRCARLRQSILKWAFEGRLADQDPADEPASVLLDRIRAERLPGAGTKPSRKPGRRVALPVEVP